MMLLSSSVFRTSSRTAVLAFVLAAVLLSAQSTAQSTASNDDNDDTSSHSYVLIGVSGGLQEGFPAHDKLDYTATTTVFKGHTTTMIKALFLGRGLVRGYKAFLDLMQPTWREYLPNEKAVMNPNVFATGCYEHANEYWLYLVDARQVMSVLNNEPRFLSMTPDTGKIELNAKETSPAVRDFLTTLTTRSDGNHKNIEHVAIPLVTAVYFNADSHIPSPPIRTHADGTQVTNYPDSLALWAGVDDSDRTAILDKIKECRAGGCTPESMDEARKAFDQYWVGIRAALKKAENERMKKGPKTANEIAALKAKHFTCQKTIQMGVGKDDDPNNTATRVNYPMTARFVESTFESMGYQVDFHHGEIVPGQTVVDEL